MVKSVQYKGSTTNTADSLFGDTPLFSTTPTKLSSTAQSLFNLEPTKPVELSPAAQSALKEMDAMQAQAEKAGERLAQIQVERMKQEEAFSKQLEARRDEMVRQAEGRRKAEEKAAEELKEKLKSDPTMLVKADIDALLSSEAYQKAGDLRRQAMMAQKAAEVRQRLIAQGVAPDEAERSARSFESSVQSDINRFKQDAEDGWLSPITDFLKRSAQQFNDWQSAGNIKDAGLISEAQSELLTRGKARGWAVDEALERAPEIRKYLVRDGAIDSLSEFRLKPGITAAEKAELTRHLETAFGKSYADFEKNNKEATDWRAGLSAEQRREMDNFVFESEQLAAKYDPNDKSFTTSLSKMWDSASLAAQYPTTLLTDNAGSVAVAAGTTVINLGLTAASAIPGVNAVAAPAAVAGWAKTAQTVRRLSNVFLNSVGNAELVEADVINSAREQIAASSVEDLRNANPEQWAAMLQISGGNEELAKQKLVTMAATDTTTQAWMLGFAAGVVGPETLISSAISRGAAKRIARDSIEGIAAQSTAQITSRNVAKNAALWSAGTLSEGAEEGITTYFTNLAVHNANGKQDLWDGVAEAFGTGAVMGGMMSSVATAINAASSVRSETELRDRAVAVAPLSDANIIARTEQYMELGNVDFNELRKTMMDDLTSFASNASHAFARSPEAIATQQQMYFDTFIDNANVLERLTSAQQRELKNLAKEAFNGNVNINGYDRAQNTFAMQALADSTQRPADPVLADAWRVIHAKEQDQVTDTKLAEATAKLYKQLFPNGNANETTRQRVDRTTQILRDIVNDDPSITASDKRTLLQRANVYFDASTRRAGDPNVNEETTQSAQGTDSSDNGGGVQQGEPSGQGQQAEAPNAGQATADSQGTRDGATRQAGEQAGGTTATAGASTDAQSDVAGTRETPQVGPTTDTSGEIDVPSATPTSAGGFGQTNQTSGPDGLAVATPTTTAESGGVARTTPTERRADGSSTTTTTTSDTLGGNSGYSAETGSLGTSNSPISTEVRDGKGNVIGYRRAGEGTFTSYRTGQFQQVALREREKLARDLETMSFTDNDLPQQVLRAIQTEPTPRQDAPATKQESSAEVIKNLINLATWQGGDISINTDSNLSVAGVVDITENGAAITLQNGHDLDTMTHELAHAITAQSIMSGNFQQEVDFLNNLADRLHGSWDDLRLQNVDKTALRRDLSYVQAFDDGNAKAAEMTALLFENRDIWQAISRLDGTPAKKRKGLLRWIDNALDALRTLLGAGSTQLSNDTFDVVTRLITGGKSSTAKGVTTLFSKKRLTSKAKQETTNETQDATSEQSTDARVATTEESADTVRDIRETDDQAGAVRGQSEETNRTAQEEPSNQVEAAEVSNGATDTATDRDDTNVSGTNQQAEPTANAVGTDTGNIEHITAADIESATTADDAVATGTVPVANNGPVTLGDTPTEQVAIIQPLLIRGTTVDTAYTNEGQYTPAEESAQAVFDTHPITDTAEDGTTVAEIAVSLADNFGVNSTEPMTPPKKLVSKKKGKPRQAVVEKFKRPDSERSDRLFTNETSLATAVHNELFKTVQEGESNQAQWLEYLVANDFEGHLAEAINSVEYLQAGIDAAMSNSSVAAARAPITDYWRWDKRSSDPKYKDKKYFSVEGAAQKVASHLAGITPRFDDYLNGMENVPRSGMAQDSAKPSVSLAKISSMKNAIYGFIHKTYIDPVLKLIEDKSFKYPKNKDIGTGMGRYAKYRHTLEEYGDSWLKGKNDEVAELRKKLAENEEATLGIVNDIVGNLTIEDILANKNSIRSTASRLSEVSRRQFNANVKEHAQLTRQLARAEKDATDSADVWFGRVSREDFPNMKLPDGHTKAELEALIAGLEATYDKADLEEVADKIYGAYAGIRTTGATYGVYDSVQLKSFNDINYKKYVHMGRGHRDKPSEFEEDVINESMFDGVDDANLVEQYKTLGLTRDLSKYKRAGSTSEMDDALANLGRLARNIAGRSASVEFEQDIQGLFEGTLNQPILEGKPTAEQIAEFKTAIVQKGAVAGLVRIRSDLPSRLVPSEFKNITPVLGKGWELNDETGEYELVPYKYYFTDPVIQNELTHNVDLNSKWNTNVVTANIRTLTRWRSSFMTSRNPMWNMWNFAREFMERANTIMFRPVVDDTGKRVSGTKLAALFAKNLSRMSVDLDLQAQIYRYLAFREMRTPVQRELHNLYTSGTIQVMTDLTDKYDFMGEQDRSALDNVANNAQKLMKRLGSKSGLTNMVNVTADQAIKWYHIRVAEVPQVVNAMAMHRAYRDAGVNQTEANHRVRDSFDPTRTKSSLMQSLSNYLPFIRSTGAGNYNTMRTLGDAFLRGSRADRAKAVTKLTLLGLSAYATVQLASAAFGDDEDGEDLIAQFDQGELNRGVPFRMSDGKVIFLPVGHGLLSVIWSFVTSMHRLVNGRTDVWGVAGNVVEQFAKNSLPANAPTSDQLANSGGKAVFLNLMPAMFLPAAEIILNQTQFGSNTIVRNETPRGERDSDQDNFNAPEVYKDMAKDIYKMTGGMVDWRPENIHHVVRSYAGVGPFRSIDAAIQDKGEKTAGVFANKGERMGVFATLVGADIGISTSILSNESRYYSLAEHKPKILRKYNVPETLTDGDTYVKVDLTGIDTSGINFDRDTSAERFAHQLRAAGASDAELQLVVNLTLADSERKELQKEMHKVGQSVYNSNRRGTATEYTEVDVFEAATALNQLYYDTVINNNQFTQRVK